MTADMMLKSYMETRRSIPANSIGEPGPDRAAVEAMLTIASRVPDHGKLAPWRFVVLSGDERLSVGEQLAARAGEMNPNLSPDMEKLERNRLARAPVVIVVISSAAPHPKIPEWEQVLSAGAVCMNLLIGANALGFAANWLTEWIAFDEKAGEILGVKDGEKIAGIVHIGTATEPPFERPRPALEDIVTWRVEGV